MLNDADMILPFFINNPNSRSSENLLGFAAWLDEIQLLLNFDANIANLEHFSLFLCSFLNVFRYYAYNRNKLD